MAEESLFLIKSLNIFLLGKIMTKEILFLKKAYYFILSDYIRKEKDILRLFLRLSYIILFVYLGSSNIHDRNFSRLCIELLQLNTKLKFEPES